MKNSCDYRTVCLPTNVELYIQCNEKKKSHQTIPIVPGSSIWIPAVYSHVQMSDLSIAEACDNLRRFGHGPVVRGRMTPYRCWTWKHCLSDDAWPRYEYLLL